MTRPFRVIIVGGGIAGLSAAIALRKADREITVYEQSAENREIGATISLQPNASKIVEQTWGMQDALLKAGGMVDGAFEIYNANGELQMRLPLKTSEKYGAERMVYHRADLHNALKERATSTAYPGQPVKIHVSSRVVGCNCDEGVVYFEDGQTAAADLIVGADGIKSTLRKVVLGKEVKALRTGHSAYRILVPTAELEKEQDFTSIINPRESKTTMVIGYDRRLIMGPARNGTAYSVVALVPDESMKESADDSSWTTAGSHEKMLESFDVFPEWAKKPLRLALNVGLWQLRDIDPLPTWYRGRTILIGDASHAMLPTQGQGASQAVEDAEALGAFFADIEGSSLAVEMVEKRNKVR